ncbi:MAG TPA: SAP domain-containing protein [Thermodesulfobacteriota bacterium]|nr:SAP domain-containing protein [Deltaproteobacteria bacterium]HNR14848.1 SAP domain-containing protein [Thermodesulfobacteriota bacterium]HNU70336.1 SAP domain-containing protein [Thermodesulfobacteriota bacterium]HOC38095.1 SAP domain-containing protein [Thermodesulfobacteriota bacterium]HQO77328.1 SAP domain-containing protein [Thermodesulfobacteriota bacterium]
MNINAVRSKAKSLGINTRNMKKTDIIRAIQRAERNIECYGSERVRVCGEVHCLWLQDCSQQDTVRSKK